MVDSLLCAGLEPPIPPPAASAAAGGADASGGCFNAAAQTAHVPELPATAADLLDPPSAGPASKRNRGRRGRSKKAGRPVEHFPAEVEKGNREYKFSLVHSSQDRLLRLTSQMKWRLAEGGGEAVYLLGVEDDGTPTGLPHKDMQVSLQKLRAMAATLDCSVESVQVRLGLAQRCKTAEVTIRAKPSVGMPAETRVAVIGEAGVGKSSLIGVLKTNEADDGCGLARLQVLQHQHELDLGRTVGVSQHSIPYDEHGSPVHDSLAEDGDVPTGIYTDQDEAAASLSACSKIVTLIDTAGDPRYAKSALVGLTSLQPDAALVVFDAQRVVALPQDASASSLAEAMPVTVNLLRICHAHKIPVGLAVTKLDLIEGALDTTVEEVYSRVKRLVSSVTGFAGEELAVLGMSSVTHSGVDALHAHLFAVSHRRQADFVTRRSGKLGAMMFVRKAFYILGFDGAILGGIPLSGTIRCGDRLKLGPDENGDFHSVLVQSIRTTHGLNVEEASEGHTVTIGVSLVAGLASDCSSVATESSASGSSLGGSAACSGSPTDGELSDEETLAASLGILRVGDDLAEASPQFDSEKEFFRHVVRRGCCLVSESAEVAPVASVKLEVLHWLRFSSGAVDADLSPEFVPDKAQFVLRCHTLKTVCQVSRAEPGMIQVDLVNGPALLPAGAPAIIHHGSLVAACRVVIAE